MTRDEAIEILARSALDAVPLPETYLIAARETVESWLNGVRHDPADVIDARMFAGYRDALNRADVRAAVGR